MKQIELNEILRKHKLWLDGDEGGVKADLREANLVGAKLNLSNLTMTNSLRANFELANLSSAKLVGANLRLANFCGADFK